MDVQLRDERIIQYLLGTLPEQDAGSFEEEYFADEELLEQMLAIREELMVDYLNDRLPEAQREQFERHFLASPRHCEMLKTTEAVLQALAPRSAAAPNPLSPAPERISWRQALSDFFSARSPALSGALAVALVASLIGVWLAFSKLRQEREELRQTREQVTQTQTESASLRHQQQDLQQQLAEERNRAGHLAEELALARERIGSAPPGLASHPDAAQNLIASVTLISDFGDGTRKSGGEPQKLILTQDHQSVRLNLKLAGKGYSSYRATVREVSSAKPVWRQAGLKAQATSSGKLVPVNLPASRFASVARDFLVVLEGQRAGKGYVKADSYSFQVERK